MDKDMTVQELKDENNILLGQNDDLYNELLFLDKQYKELAEYARLQDKVLKIIKEYVMPLVIIDDYVHGIGYACRFPASKDLTLLKKWLDNKSDLEQTLSVRAKKAQGYDIIMQILLSDEGDPRLMPDAIVKATEEEFGKNSKEAAVMKELMDSKENSIYK